MQDDSHAHPVVPTAEVPMAHAPQAWEAGMGPHHTVGPQPHPLPTGNTVQ